MFRNLLNNKIGNLLNYLSTKVPNLSMTKALKLLYLIDETAYQRTGVPVTWLEYKVWEMGPVADELYNELRYNQFIAQNGSIFSLDNYITTDKKTTADGNPLVIIFPNGNYALDEFSVFETTLIDNIIDRFGSYSAAQLITLLHDKKTLWHQCVTHNNLDLNFKVYGKKSNHTIDFSELIKDDPILQMSAQVAYENMQLQEDMYNL